MKQVQTWPDVTKNELSTLIEKKERLLHSIFKELPDFILAKVHNLYK